MHLRRRDDTLVVSSSPRLLLAIALAFVTVGTLGVAIALFGEAGRALHGWPWLAALSAGVAILAGGVLVLTELRFVRLSLDRAAGRGTLTTEALWDSSRVDFRLGDVRGIEVLRERDGDGDPKFRLRLWLTDGRALALHGTTLYDGESAEGWARRIERFVRGEDA